VYTRCNILLAFQQQETIDKIKNILVPMGYSILGTSTSGMQALRLAGMNSIDIAVVGYNLSDMPGLTFANDLLSRHQCSVIMIAPPEQINYIRSSAGTSDIVCLSKPVTPQALLTSVDLVMQYREKLLTMNKEVQKLKSDLKRRAIAEKAKTLLMNNLNMGEAEAWRYIQKESMNKGIPLQRVAESILEKYGKL